MSTGEQDPKTKWIIALTVVFGAFMAVMDVSVVNVAMPHMMGSFGQNLENITWVATSYSIAEIIMLTMAGWFSTVLGRKRLYLLSFAVFTAASMLAGTAHTFTEMLVYRTIQGFGGGSLIPVSQAILRETFPDEEQGMAMALYGMGVVLAPGIGAILGGWLTDHYGWPWIFYINLPVSLCGMVMVASFVHDPPYLKRGIKRVDWLGITFLAMGLTGMQIVLARGEQDNWFQSRWIVEASVVTVFALIALVVWEMRTDEPVINFHLFRNFPLALGSIMGLIFGLGLFGTTFALPQLTQDLLGYSALQAGLVLLPRAVGLFLIMPVAGWAYRYFDARILVGCGLGLMCVAFYDLSHLSLTVNFRSLLPMLLIMGAGMPFMFVTLSTVSLSSVSRTDMTEASSLYTLARRVGGNIGYAMAATVVANRVQFHHVRVAAHLALGNPIYAQRLHALAAALTHAGMTSIVAMHAAYGVINRMVNQQVTLLAYNDVSWVMGWLFMLTVPLIFFLPKPGPRQKS